jgi:rSAM/selenodomain-associated transferase 1
MIFAKEPRAGDVKTRLCPPLELAEAARLYEALLGDVLTRFRSEPRLETSVHVAPESAVELFRRRLPEWLAAAEPSSPPAALTVVAQRGVGLAERIEHAFDAALDRTGRAVLVGTDLPLLTPAHVLEAHARLADGAELVLAPDGGGGYGLIGLSRPAPRLFRGVRMSTERVFETTVAIARELGLATSLLAPIADVDTAQDLRALHAVLASGADALGEHWPARTAARLDELCARYAELRGGARG